jgi:isopentenyl-diphosphate delta-isomerase
LEQELTSARKKAHIDLAFQSQVAQIQTDTRFHYEPVLAGHPSEKSFPTSFLGKQLNVPVWVSSMTGGTELAGTINRNLAKACKQFGMGMGLGSCRIILDSDEHLDDFALRSIIGNDLPFYANLGIAQVEELVVGNKFNKITELISKLEADGLIIHINPMQEWLQPEGDKIQHPPIDTIKRLLDRLDVKLIVKEVGQGMGPKSLETLFSLPIEAVEFAALGGTNFAKLELIRGSENNSSLYNELAYIGHSAEEMVGFANDVFISLGDKAKCKQVIVSGGVKGFLDGYYHLEKINCNAVYGQASAFLKHATDTYEELEYFIKKQLEGFALAKAFLKVK